MSARRTRLTVSWLVAAAITAGSGCSSKSSSDGGEGGSPIATRDMHLSATVEAANDFTAEVSVKMHNGDPLTGTVYSLTGGDGLSACVGTQCRPLSHDLLSQTYEAELPYVAETAYTIAFSRRAGANAPSSMVTLPVSFAILAPGSGLQVTDGHMVTVQWSPAGVSEVANVTGHARCDHEDGARTNRAAPPLALDVDTGAVTVSVDTIVDARPLFTTSHARVLRCDVVLEVAHERRGTVDDTLAGDSIAGRVTRSVTLDYTPSAP
jgi:hypothetical protein